jgi:molecular chaperone IbpA
MKISFGNLYPSTLGFETILRDIESIMQNSVETVSDKFPPHNIIKVNDTHYMVELAIAGFDEKEIDITVKDGLMTVKGEKQQADNEVNYLHKGIGTRSFSKTIRLADTIEVEGAAFKNGILSIGLENIIPESKKPKKIEIGTLKNFSMPKLEKKAEEILA